MKPRNATELAIMCVFGVVAIAVLVGGITVMAGKGGGKGVVWLVLFAALSVGAVAWARAFGARRDAKAELVSGEEYHRLADEYRRLADMAITAQEHTDLKLGGVSVQMDYLREQMESLQKILKEVE
jgi:predicted aspartyl protease